MSSSDDDVIGRPSRAKRPDPINTDPPKKKTGAELLAEMRAKRAALSGAKTPSAGTPAGTPGKSKLSASQMLERLRSSRANTPLAGRKGNSTPMAGGASGLTGGKVTAASIAMNNAQNIWNETMSTLRVQQRKHAVHKQADNRPDPELHLIGEITAASGFGPNGISVRYEFVTVYVDWTFFFVLFFVVVLFCLACTFVAITFPAKCCVGGEGELNSPLACIWHLTLWFPNHSTVPLNQPTTTTAFRYLL